MRGARARRRAGGHAAGRVRAAGGNRARPMRRLQGHGSDHQLEGVDHNAHNASVVAIRPPTGEILAMVGSVDYNNEEIDGEVNMALADRQPGSSFKPFTYLESFLQGYTPATRIMDVRTVFPNAPEPPYVPENYDRAVSWPAAGPLRPGPFLQYPRCLADGQGGRQERHRPGAQAGHQLAGQGILRPEPDAGRRRSEAAGHGVRQQRLCQPGRHGRRAGAGRSAAAGLSQSRPGEHPAGARQGRPDHLSVRAAGDRAPHRSPDGLPLAGCACRTTTRARQASATGRVSWNCRTARSPPRPARPTAGRMAGPSAMRRNWPWASGLATPTTRR